MQRLLIDTEHARIIMPMNKTVAIFHLEKTVYESHNLPSEWQRLKDNFVGIIQRA
jgi:hypothetical protein